MKVELLKDWGKHKKAAEIEVIDPAVISAGIEKGVFVEVKEPKEVKPKAKKQ